MFGGIPHEKMPELFLSDRTLRE